MKTAEVIFNEHSWKAIGAISPSKDFCLKAMQDFARQTSIEFAKWLNFNGWQEYDEPDRWICPTNNRNVYTTEQVYNQFLKDKSWETNSNSKQM